MKSLHSQPMHTGDQDDSANLSNQNFSQDDVRANRVILEKKNAHNQNDVFARFMENN